MTGIPDFNQRVYEFARTIPRGETRTYGEVASGLARIGRGAFGGAGDRRAIPS